MSTGCAWSWLPALQRHEVRHDVEPLPGTEALLKGRHGRLHQYLVFVQFGFVEGDETLLIVKDLNRIRVLVESTARDHLAALRDGTHRAIDWHHRAARVGQCDVQAGRRTNRSDVAQIG